MGERKKEEDRVDEQNAAGARPAVRPKAGRPASTRVRLDAAVCKAILEQEFGHRVGVGRLREVWGSGAPEAKSLRKALRGEEITTELALRIARFFLSHHYTEKVVDIFSDNHKETARRLIKHHPPRKIAPELESTISKNAEQATTISSSPAPDSDDSATKTRTPDVSPQTLIRFDDFNYMMNDRRPFLGEALIKDARFTDVLNTLRNASTQGERRHCLVVGPSGSGKTTLARQAVRGFVDNFPAAERPEAWAVPFSEAYPAGPGWTVEDSLKDLVNHVAAMESNAPQVVILDDVQECADPARRLVPYGTGLNAAFCIATARWNGRERAKKFLESQLDMTNIIEIQTDPKAVAKALIQERLVARLTEASDEIRRIAAHEAYGLFVEGGHDLLFLEAALAEWEFERQAGSPRPLSRDHAFRAVGRVLEGTLDRLGPASDKNAARAAVAVAWALGGLEMPVSAAWLRDWIGIEAADEVVTRLVRACELTRPAGVSHRVTRHSSWGRLVIRALEDERLAPRSTGRVVCQSIDRGLAQFAADLQSEYSFCQQHGVGSGLLLLDLLSVERSAPGRLDARVSELAYFCSGCTFSESFLPVPLEFVRLRPQLSSRKVSFLLSAADASRRLVVGNGAEPRAPIRVAEDLLLEAEATLRDDLVATQTFTRRDWLLYTKAYLLCGKGDFAAAEATFRESGNHSDFPHDVQARHMAATMLKYQGKLDEAEAEIAEAERILASFDQGSDKVVQRTCANLAMSRAEVAILRRQADAAEELLAKARALHSWSSSVVVIGTWDARVDLLRGHGRQALERLEAFGRNPDNMHMSEWRCAYHRIRGDAFLLLGDVANATTEYRLLVPRPDDPESGAWFDGAIARTRLQELAKGRGAEEVLAVGGI